MQEIAYRNIGAASMSPKNVSLDFLSNSRDHTSEDPLLYQPFTVPVASWRGLQSSVSFTQWWWHLSLTQHLEETEAGVSRSSRRDWSKDEVPGQPGIQREK